MRNNSNNHQLISWLLLLLLSSVWGSSYILMKKALQVFSFHEVACLRIISAGIVLLPLSITQLQKLPIRYYKPLLLTGFIGTLAPAFLFATAQIYLDSALNGAMNSLSTIFTLIVGALFFQQPIFKKEIFGALLGIIGTLLLLFTRSSHGIQGGSYYIGLPILASLCYGINLNLVKYYLQDLKATTIASISFLFMGILSSMILFTQTNFIKKLQMVEGAYLAGSYILILGIAGSAIAYFLFTALIQRTSPIFASMLSFLIPIVAIAWGLFDGEKLLWGHYVGLIAILSGVYLVNKQHR